eukprot:4762219-Amphidinium_carterae.1
MGNYFPLQLPAPFPKHILNQLCSATGTEKNQISLKTTGKIWEYYQFPLEAYATGQSSEGIYL